MESMISTNYMSKAIGSSDEESSWTLYLEDFMAYKEDENEAGTETKTNSLLSSGCGSSSMASDASCSSVVRKQRFDTDERRVGPVRRVSSKKRKTRAALVDHDLEDTASSPDHTPKAIDFNKFLMDCKEMSGSKGIFQEHNVFQKLNKQQDDGVCITTCEEKENKCHKMSSEEIDLLGKDSYCTELRRKGLCLVPVSMIFNCVS